MSIIYLDRCVILPFKMPVSSHLALKSILNCLYSCFNFLNISALLLLKISIVTTFFCLLSRKGFTV